MTKTLNCTWKSYLRQLLFLLFYGNAGGSFLMQARARQGVDPLTTDYRGFRLPFEAKIFGRSKFEPHPDWQAG